MRAYEQIPSEAVQSTSKWKLEMFQQSSSGPGFSSSKEIQGPPGNRGCGGSSRFLRTLRSTAAIDFSFSPKTARVSRLHVFSQGGLLRLQRISSLRWCTTAVKKRCAQGTESQGLWIEQIQANTTLGK